MSGLTVAFEDTGCADARLAGGKGANLAELWRLGLGVPRGFVVTTGAFRLGAERFDPAGRFAAEIAGLDASDLGSVAAVTARIRDSILESPLPKTLIAEVEERYSAEGADGADGADDPGPAVAVRSSAVGEDGAGSSFAGLQETYLNVRGAGEVVSAVRACWASLYSIESVTYRLQRALPEEEAAMAVVVQLMADARSSGVMFTRSPSTGDRSVVAIEAAWGLGSAVVSGAVTPDSFVLSKVTGEILRRRLSPKQIRHSCGAGGGLVEEDVPPELQGAPSVSDAELGRLLDLALCIESHYGCAQDIEWSIASEDRDGRDLLVLQSRPETVWSQKETPPAAGPKARAFDHVIEMMGRG
ncbi:MAG: PEP/pyruvate-binding domain-containing protein [Acidimicrobiales bacterium]